MRIAILAVILLSVSTTALTGSGLAPPDTAFLDYLHRRTTTAASDGHALGVIPSPVNPSRHRGTVAPAPLVGDGLPATYDLRTLGRVTSVKDQLACSSCWAFATCGATESAALPAQTLDLSEMHLNCEHGFDLLPCTGGNTIMAMAYMSRWSGPLWESDDPYNGPVCDSPTGVPARRRLRDVSFIPDRSGPLDNDTLKTAIMTTGALYVTMSWVQNCYNESTHSYYYSGPYGMGIHAVCLVGWDDNYDKGLFLAEPPGNGAFICKNSWGTMWGDNGYFHVSYYDSVIGRDAGVIATTAPDTDIDRVYDYDPLGWVGNYGYYDGDDWFANVFTAGRDEQLMAASWYSAVPNCSYTVQVYLDPAGGPTNPGGPVATKSGTFSAAGYHILALDTPVALQSGHEFSVVVRNATPGYAYPIPVEYLFEGYAGAATSNPGESFVSSDGLLWMDAIDLELDMFQANVCLKAFTGVPPVPVATPVFDPDGGMFYDPPNVTITCATEGATIHYTTKTHDPTELDPVVEGPILVDRNRTLKARAFKAGMLPSEVKSADFYIIQLAGLKDLPNDTAVTITRAIVTAAPAAYFYVEADDRSSGIRVNKSPHSLLAGMRADFTGQMKTNTIGERYVLATTAAQSLPPWDFGSVEPILLTNREVGGCDWHYNPATGAGQVGVKGGSGLNNIGLLVTVTGEVTYSPLGPAYSVLSDGSAVIDPSGYPGIRVLPFTAITRPLMGQHAIVTGVCTLFPYASDPYPQIRPRTQADIVPYW